MHSPILYVILSMVPSTTYLLLCTYLVVVLSMYLLLTYVERERESNIFLFYRLCSKAMECFVEIVTGHVLLESKNLVCTLLYKILYFTVFGQNHKILLHSVFLKKQKSANQEQKVIWPRISICLKNPFLADSE